MKQSKNSWRNELRITELIEQSIFLVRSTFPANGWIYYLATIPFIITLLYFWSIMSSKLIGPFEISNFALLLTLLFWIKVTGQSIYCKILLSKLMDDNPFQSISQLSNIAVNSIFVHPLAIILLMSSCLFIVLSGSAIIFSQYLFIASTEHNISALKTIKTSFKFATQESIYQHLVLFFLISLSLIIFFNVILILILFPQLLKTFFNIETVFTQSPFSFLNTTFIMIALCISYLIFDPIFKGFYVNLYFHMKSRSSGEDIMAECRRLSQIRGLKRVFTTIFILLVILLSLPSPVLAQKESKKTIQDNQQSVKVEKSHVKKMDKAIKEALRDDVYRWRYKELKQKEEGDKGFVLQMIEDLIITLGKWLNPVVRFVENILDRIGDFFKKLFSPKGRKKLDTSEPFWADMWPKIITVITVFIFLLGVIYLFWQHHKDKIKVVPMKKKKIPNLMEEEVDATELQEHEWLKLSKEFRSKGELTLALRSAFLAILSFFHRNNYLVFERYKTNYNYLAEVRHNTRNDKDLMENFLTCIEIFERSWYGRYPVNMDILERFETYQNGIMGT